MRPAIAILPVLALLLALWRSEQTGAELGDDAATIGDAAGMVDLGHAHVDERRSSSSSRSGSDPRLPDLSNELGWRAFRREHPRVALASEFGVTWILNDWHLTLSQRDLAGTCLHTGVPFPDVSIGAWLRLHGRGLAIDGLDCEPERSGDGYAEQFCRCLVEGLPPDAFVELPADVSDADLADYQGPIILDHWRCCSPDSGTSDARPSTTPEHRGRRQR